MSVETDSPVPSITLSITQDDVKRVLDASSAMETTLDIMQKRHTDPSATKLAKKSSDCNQTLIGDAESTMDGSSKSCSRSVARPLHEVVLDAAHQCENSTLRSFLNKMKSSGSSPKEIHVGVLVFCDMDFRCKMRLIFDILGSNASLGSGKEHVEKALDREGVKSLFRSVIVAISSCIYRGPSVEIEMEEDTCIDGPLRKKMKQSDSSSPRSGDSIPELKSPSSSFDSSIALKESEQIGISTVRKEFEEIAAYATDCLVKYCQRKSPIQNISFAVSFETFCTWKDTEGGRISPWLDLLNLSKWKTPTRPAMVTKEREVLSRNVLERGTVIADSAYASEQRHATSGSQKTSPKKNEHHPLPTSTKKPDAFRVPCPTVFGKPSHSRTVVSFDFTGASQIAGENSDFHINISEGNLLTLRNLVRATGLATRHPNEIAKILLSASKSCTHDGVKLRVIPIERFHTCLHQLLGSTASRRLSKVDRDVFSSSFVDFFSCFNTCAKPLAPGEANACELAVGFCFLCDGNKSSKLASGFDLLENGKAEGLSTAQLAQFLRSYLTMLVGISLLTSSSDGVMKPKQNSAKRKAMHAAVENGAKWTLAHYLKHVERTGHRPDRVMHTFDGFADWYTSGGYNVAPWLELLDLKKLLSLIGDSSDCPSAPSLAMHDPLGVPSLPASGNATPQYISPRRSRILPPSNLYASPKNSGPQTEVLFTFPLANQRSLVVLREDATYVNDVVNKLGLLSCSPDDVWSSLFNVARNEASNSRKRGKNMTVNRSAFTRYMEETIAFRTSQKKRGASGTAKSVSNCREVVRNLFHSFDLHQMDNVPLNELMGGLTLLCGGKKSTKLAFAFGVFDQRCNETKRAKNSVANANSLNGAELFLFLRSFLIVMFSCCRQSLDLSDDSVNRYIADTANMVTDDVIRYQWKTKKKDRVDFDEFGLWYNEGGYESAPWLELLDLQKWVLTEEMEALPLIQTSAQETSGFGFGTMLNEELDCPPPPPDDAVDSSFFDDDDNAIMPMESIDEMDLMLMEPTDKENDAVLNKISRSFSYSPRPQQEQQIGVSKTSSLKFHLIVEGQNAGYVVAVSQKRIRHIRHILEDSGLCKLEGEVVSKEILKQALVGKGASQVAMITKEGFLLAMRNLILAKAKSADAEKTVLDVLSRLYAGFDYSERGQVDATEIACGITILCKGKKSDKLEFAFEMLGRDKGGRLSRHDSARYLRSFLTVLLNLVSIDTLDGDINQDVMTTSDGSQYDRGSAALARVVEGGSMWAANQTFQKQDQGQHQICFDEFAEWYTQVGYSNIPWLELLDLQKWIIVDR
ncbi:unnamed protein product [Cylindrotheca closterium]|uniref:Calmodulin n=1 Tax=Cylindrotheca closterium TaxID=2856 RepID=A0AAD2FZH7_9STRA|nr:unnamed protein product [Cylindrotheca closterium]